MAKKETTLEELKKTGYGMNSSDDYVHDTEKEKEEKQNPKHFGMDSSEWSLSLYEPEAGVPLLLGHLPLAVILK